MKVLKAVGTILKNFFIVFSFIVNIILVAVILVLAATLFDIKNNIVTPLITGLHSSFVGLDEATIDWTIPVRDSIPVVLDIPLQTNTVVTLTDNVPLFVQAAITLPGGGGNLSATVNLTLPQGLELPVALDLNVPVNQELPVALDVRAVIPVSETQLHDPIDNLRLTFEPIVRALYNLPNNYADAVSMASAWLSAQGVNLLAENAYSVDPWPGFNETAGLNYPFGNEPLPIANQPLVTGIVPVGGIPALDQQLRPDLYANGGSPQAANAAAQAQMNAVGIPAHVYDGSFARHASDQRALAASGGPASDGANMPLAVPTAVTLPIQNGSPPG
jgi:hypothetical protein